MKRNIEQELKNVKLQKYLFLKEQFVLTEKFFHYIRIKMINYFVVCNFIVSLVKPLKFLQKQCYEGLCHWGRRRGST